MATVIGAAVVGVVAEAAFLTVADATGNCQTRAMAHGLVTTVNEGLIEAGIESLAGDDTDSTPAARLRLHAINVFVNGTLADEGAHGYEKQALIEAAKEQFPDDQFAAAYLINAVGYYITCKREE